MSAEGYPEILTVVVLLGLDAVLTLAALYFTVESLRERETRAAGVGALLVLTGLLLGVVILLIPVLRVGVALLFLGGGVFGFVMLLPGRGDPRELRGTRGHVVGEVRRPDERDTVFARQRGLPEGSEIYVKYYQAHPDREKRDKARRARGFLGRPGGIDRGPRPLVSVMDAAGVIPRALGPYGECGPAPGSVPAKIDPERATEFVKGLLLHLGADMVGVCRVDPMYVYSHRGDVRGAAQEEWGMEINPEDLPPYAVVFLTEMGVEHLMCAPHTPSVAESLTMYARGAYLSVFLARWFAAMGYRGVAQNTYRYHLIMPPLGVDAGLGEVGRQGYLIAPRYGARVRVFAVLTDMPLVPDRPISLGVEMFCRGCRKCADSCPSGSIPGGGKVIHNGVRKWKIDADSCFGYWSRVGTDCGICMIVCPFSRPDTPLHNMFRWLVARSPVARRVFPYLDAIVYGRRWRPGAVAGWLDHRQGPHLYGVNRGA